MTASARDSLASPSPRRRLTAGCKTLYSASCKSGFGVLLSNGSTATVLIEDGSPPPANPYFHTQPSAAHSTAASPNTRVIVRADPRALMRVLMRPTRAAAGDRSPPP